MRIELGTGIFRGVALFTDSDGRTQGLRLLKDAHGHYPRSGTFISSPLPIPRAKPMRIAWSERWTGPLAWEKDEHNPVLTGTPGAWDAPGIAACSVIRMQDTYRLYYGSRPGGIGVAEAPVNAPHQWKKRPQPIFTAGASADFDGGGVLSPEIVPVTDTHWHMYYVGYHPTKIENNARVHQLGLAESDDGGWTWRRVGGQSVIPTGPRGSFDGFATSSCSVLRVGGRWLAWYSGIAQAPYLGGIGLATSEDGHTWRKYPHNPVLYYNPHLAAEAFALLKPHVIYQDGVFRMWTSAIGYGEGRRPGDYRVCYAESLDGIHWDRDPDGPVLEPSAAGWDSRMVEYAEVLHDDRGDHMWYCGNQYSQIGYARGQAKAGIAVRLTCGSTPAPNQGWSEPRLIQNHEALTFPERASHFQIIITLETKDPAFTPAIQNPHILKCNGRYDGCL